MLSCYDKDLRVSFAANLLEKDPLEHWKSHKLMAFKTNTLAELHDWEKFNVWCLKTLNMHDSAEIAFQQFTNLKQTSTVIAYKPKFDLLALHAGITPEQQLKYWYDGLKPDILNQTCFDPVYRGKCKSSSDAQAVAVAVGSFPTTENGNDHSNISEDITMGPAFPTLWTSLDLIGAPWHTLTTLLTTLPSNPRSLSRMASMLMAS